MIKYFPDLLQGTEEWFECRRGLLTASEMKLIITPTGKIADNDDVRTHVYELLSQRISKFVEPTYIGEDMMRGKEDEILGRQKYSEAYAPVKECGFVTNDKLGFPIGYSPDGLVGEDGQIEGKSRKQKYQLETILSRKMPENKKINCMLQVQTGLFVTERKWCDFFSYSGGFHMVTYRIYPDPKVHEAIETAAKAFEDKIKEKLAEYEAIMKDPEMRILPTERRKIVGDMIVGDTDE